MTDSMIERVARAIHDAGDSGIEWDGSPALQAVRCEQARAAIEAMREPTEDMLYTGNAQIPDWDRQIEDVRNTWHAMIDAALKEKP